jgi:MoxR-like ATPase
MTLTFGKYGKNTQHKDYAAMQFLGTDKYYLNPELKEIVNIATAMEKPLLVTGEAGTGKTQLGFEISRALEMTLEEARCKSTFKGEELCYVYDTVLRLNDSRFGTGESGRDVNNIWDYLSFGPIGRAFLAEDRRVLLLDEIDKTDSDTQDNLLDVLEDGSFIIREINHKVKAKQMPITIITSNAKRELSDPFLRRCYCHHIPFPSMEEMSQIVRLHYPEVSAPLMDSALAIFYHLRQQGFEKPPATAELLDWLGALQIDGAKPPLVPDKIPFLGTLLKRTQDLLQYKGVERESP